MHRWVCAVRIKELLTYLLTYNARRFVQRAQLQFSITTRYSCTDIIIIIIIIII